MSRRRLFGLCGALAGALATDIAPAEAADPRPPSLMVPAGSVVTVDRTTRLSRLTVQPGGVLAAPAGRTLTLTVDGVETGTKLTVTGGEVAQIVPGDYRGDVTLTVCEQNTVLFHGLRFQLRQGLYVAADGPDPARSVSAAWLAGRVAASRADGLALVSHGEVFNGVYVDGGRYLLSRPRLDFDGNGRCDFVGYGAALVATGTAARLSVDRGTITTRGAVRTAVVVTGGATAVVKDSVLRSADGVLPADYVPTVELQRMETAPWMLGLSGDVRTTNILGERSTAAYLGCHITSQGWGVLSSDDGHDCRLLAVDSRIANIGDSGYGAYAIGGITEHFLGCDFDVADYAAINRGGALHYADSSPDAVRELNDAWDLGLSDHELAALTLRAGTVSSRRFGIMWHGSGSVHISGGTVFRTAETTFLNKGQQARITVDGSAGARLLPRNGVLLQMIDDDDPCPGPGSAAAPPLSGLSYSEPSAEPARAAGFDTTAVHPTDAVAEFTDIDLTGDIYNGVRGGTKKLPGLNLAVTLNRCRLSGAVTSSTARHRLATIDAAHRSELGMVADTPSPAVNNGVILTLGPHSRWFPTGTCHLSALHVDAAAQVSAPQGRALEMTVDGRSVHPAPGTDWTGVITINIR